MAEEEKKDETPADDSFLLGGKTKVTRDYYGSAKVTRDKDGLPQWLGGEKLERDSKSRAIKVGEKEIVRNPRTGQIEKIGEEAVHWRDEEKIRKFLDSQ